MPTGPLIDVDPRILGTNDADAILELLEARAAELEVTIEAEFLAEYLATENRTVEDVSDLLENVSNAVELLTVLAAAGGSGSSSGKVRVVNAIVSFELGGAYDGAVPIPEGAAILVLEQADPAKNGVYTYDVPGEDEGTFSARFEPLPTDSIFSAASLTTTDDDTTHPQIGTFLAVPLLEGDLVGAQGPAQIDDEPTVKVFTVPAPTAAGVTTELEELDNPSVQQALEAIISIVSPAGIPDPSDPDGTYVLTATKTGSELVFSWEPTGPLP